METNESNRQFLRNDGWDDWDIIMPDQKAGIPPPALQKPPPPGASKIELESINTLAQPNMTLFEAIARRRSVREYSNEPLTQSELSFLLWATQGVHKIADDMSHVLRSVPSAGARHPFEAYLIVKRVEGLKPGLYRYLALEHKLCLLNSLEELEARAMNDAWLLPGEAVIFIWTAVPYRTEWRYDILSHKMIAMEAGHICQNLYLAAAAIGAGSCAIGAFSQDEIDGLLSVDGIDEFAVYMATVGKQMFI